jgi:5-methylcytosine-specific restriction endonuclease McrBC GTP-binding regulatory subunit McrB
MAKLSKIINFLNDIDKEIEEEVYNREDQANEQEYKSENWRDSDKGIDYVYKTEALDELREKIFEVIEQAEKIKNKDYY